MFRDMKVAPRAALGFGLIALVVLLLGLFALNQMSVMREQSRDLDENWLPSILALSELDRTMLRIRAVTLRLSAVRDERSQQQTLAQLNELLARSMAWSGSIAATSTTRRSASCTSASPATSATTWASMRA